MARVLLLFGGRSEEHEVSCVSGVAALEALATKGHEVVLVGIDRSGGWHLADPAVRPLEASGPAVTLEVPAGELVADGRRIAVDVAFPVLHGPFGEDGTIQGLFEMIDLPYVGSGVLGSAIGMDKDVAKRLCRDAGIPVGPFAVVRASEWAGGPEPVVGALADDLGYPVFVKPAALGSSVGISKAADDGELKGAVDEALRHGTKAVVEAAIEGREIEVAVLEGPRSSVPGEIVVHGGWYDYDAKYRDDATELFVPAQLSEAATEQVRDLAARAFEVLEGVGLARVDFFYEEKGRGFLLNELNTMPGFTPVSMFPMLWAATGMPYADLCDELVSLAMGR
ncbi:MAG TPA: D-alanine--D-alanine ligase family protein [Acidimicrobiia bacterium]|nr:D-alanine--D-alanine ligase family protein [Acidimicrobiia bacterium]